MRFAQPSDALAFAQQRHMRGGSEFLRCAQTPASRIFAHYMRSLDGVRSFTGSVRRAMRARIRKLRISTATENAIAK